MHEFAIARIRCHAARCNGYFPVLSAAPPDLPVMRLQARAEDYCEALAFVRLLNALWRAGGPPVQRFILGADIPSWPAACCRARCQVPSSILSHISSMNVRCTSLNNCCRRR